ncbi:RNA polymerase sigma factor [Sinomicrobium sp.]
MKYQPKNKAELLNALHSGDKAAFKYIFEAFYDDLVCYIYSLCNNRAKAEDIVQNVFVKLWEQHDTIAVHTSLKNYLFRASHNLFINSLRRNRNTVFLSDHLYLESFLAEETEGKEALPNRETLQQAIDTLPERCREIFVLHKIKGMKYSQIAQKLNISIKTVENQMSKAYQKLRKMKNRD